MPKIADAVSANAVRIAAGGETGTGVGPQQMQSPGPISLAPPQDLPAGGGLPQRGMFPADLTLNSDRSDSNRAFRGQGVRSSTFPYSPTSGSISTTIIEKATSSSSGSSGSSSSISLDAGPGISITVSGQEFTIGGTAGQISVPDIFSISGALPIVAFPDGGTIFISLLPEDANTFFAGPYASGILTGFDKKATSNASNQASASIGPLSGSSGNNEWGVLVVSAETSVSGSPTFTPAVGWTQLQPTVGSNGQGLSWYNNSSGALTGTVGFSPNADWVGALMLFYAPSGNPTVAQNKFQSGLGAGSYSITMPSATVAGNALLLIMEDLNGSSNPTYSSISDTGGNSWTQIARSAQAGGFGGYQTVTVYFANNISGGADTISFTQSGGSSGQGIAWVAEVSGLQAPSPIPTFRFILNQDLQYAIFGAAGSSHAPGAVPDPGATAHTPPYYLGDDTDFHPLPTWGVGCGIETPVNGEIPLYMALPVAVTFPAGAGLSTAVAKIAATGSTTYTFKKNGSAFATAVWAVSGTTATWTQASDASFNGSTDILEIDGPATADATLANIGIALVGNRS